MYLGMSAMLQQKVIANEIIVRYLTGHPVSTATLILFFVGVGSLLMIATNVFGQWGAANRIHFHDPTPGELSPDVETKLPPDPSRENEELSCVEQAIELGHQLLQMPKRLREHYLWQRLHESLHFVHRTGSAKGLENETKYLSELDLDEQQQRYSLVRILIWATPMLGFLGTVLGISQALGGINVGPENNFQEMMNGLRSSLYVAFDTTALALVLSMALMFGQFLVDRIELQLLKYVDYRTRQELAARFDMSADSELDAVEKMGIAVMATADQLVKRQSELWRSSISAAEKAWEDSITGVNEQMRDNLASALNQTIEKMTSTIGNTIQKADDSMAHRWQQWQVTLSDSARSMKEQQRELNSQTRLIKELVDSVTDKIVDPAISGRAESTAPVAAPATGQSPTTHETGAETPAHQATTKARSPHIYFSAFSPDAGVASSDLSQISDLELAVDHEHEDDSEVLIAPQSSNQSVLRLLDPDESMADDVQPGSATGNPRASIRLPRYRYAEQIAGVDPVMMFPVQIDTKKAA
jgi:hypothetical protein